MSVLLVATFILVGPALIARVIGGLNQRFHIGWHTPARMGVSLLFLITGIAHFLETEAMSQMLPAFVPRRNAIIYVTGVLELLGAIGIWIPLVSAAAGGCLVLFIIAVFPANLYAALHHLPIAGHEDGAWYLLLRVPFELFLIVWVYRATGQRWFSGFCSRI